MTQESWRRPMLKKEDWLEIRAEAEKGVYKKDITEQLGIHPKTISRALHRGGAPSGKRSAARLSKLDPFNPLVDQLLREGVWNAMVILREIESRGYTGSSAILRETSGPEDR
jgi:hypothetical protein